MSSAVNEFHAQPSDIDQSVSSPERLSTGILELDEILDGGLIARRDYLVRGGPGLGKTTLGLHFLCAGHEGERALFIGFQESEAELRANAASVGIDTSNVNILSLAESDAFFTEAQAYDVFAASDVEQAPMVNQLVEAIDRIRPTRVFVDSLTQLRFVSADLGQFRKQVASFLRFLDGRGATVLFTSESTREVPDDDLQFIADGVIALAQGPSSSELRVTKFRGSGFQRGAHPFRVDDSGFHVYRRTLPPPQRVVETAAVQLRSGNAELDGMLEGGVEAGTVTLVTGPTGIGKSTLAGLFAVASARAGRPAAVYQFEEEMNGWLARLRTLGVDADSPVREGMLSLEQVEPLRYLAAEFTNNVSRRVREEGLELVVIDSVAGFELALGGEEDVKQPLHAFIKTLSRLGVTVILVNENHAAVGNLQVSEREISYVADNVIYLAYVQSGDALAKIIGIMKKRLSGFDTRQRAFEIGPGGIRINGLASELGISVGIGNTPSRRN